MRHFVSILIFSLLTTSLFAKEQNCSPESRLSTYDELKTDVNKLISALPTLTPSKRSFFQRAGLAYYNKHKNKYKKIILSDSFVAFNNGAKLDELLTAVKGLMENNKVGDFYSEINFISKITNNLLLNSTPNEAYMDSKLLLERKIVDEEYIQTAKSLYKHVVKINSCTPEIIFKLKNK